MVARFFHGDTIEGFLAMPEAQIVGNLTTAHTSLHASLQGLQSDAWREEISLLKKILPQYIGRGHIYFEYTIPRMGRRIDVILLTRARQGMVLVVPEGNPEDPTRNPAYYDSTYEYLKEVGIKEI